MTVLKKSASLSLFLMTSGAFLCSCHPLLASRGVTNSPYKPAAATSGNSNTASANQPTPIATVTPVIAPAPAPSPTPISRPDGDRLLNSLTDTQELRIRFNHRFAITVKDPVIADANDDGCFTTILSNGSVVSSADGAHFSCTLHLCVFKAPNDKSLRMVIGKNADYHGQVSISSDDSDQAVFLMNPQRSNASDPAALLRDLTCVASSGSKVGDLIDLFGKDDQKNDNVDIRVQPVGAQSAQPQVVVPANMQMKFKRRVSLDVSNRHLASIDGEEITRAEYEEKPHFDFSRPTLGFQFMGSVDAFGHGTISPAQQSIRSGGFLIQAEYQPAFLQSIGVFSMGPSVATYPTLGQDPSGNNVTSGFFGIWGVGGQARYQFRYFDGQPVVPYVSYEAQSVSYNINQGGSGRLTIAGGSAGLAFLLNRLAPAEAHAFYESMGFQRSYLVIEGKNMVGSDENVRASGASLYFGLRFER